MQCTLAVGRPIPKDYLLLMNVNTSESCKTLKLIDIPTQNNTNQASSKVRFISDSEAELTTNNVKNLLILNLNVIEIASSLHDITHVSARPFSAS